MKILIAAVLILLLASPCLASDTLIPTISPSTTINGYTSVTVSGTATDTSNDENITPGIARVEVKIDSNSWVTADGTTAFSYTFSDLNAGNHVIGVRAIDYSYNPSVIEYLDIVLYEDTSDDEDDEDDLSWYIGIDDLSISTMEDINVRTIEEGTDVCISFDIENDFTSSRKIRYTISKGSTYDYQDNVVVDDDDSESIDEWISGAYLTVGTNTFNIILEDWDTQDTVAEKSISVKVVEYGTLDDDDETTTTKSSSDDEIPEWFIEIAEKNDIVIEDDDTSAEVRALQSTIDGQAETIESLQISIADLKEAIENNPVSTTSSSKDDDDDDVQRNDLTTYWWLVPLGIVGYAKRDKINRFLKSDDSNSDIVIENTMTDRELRD